MESVQRIVLAAPRSVSIREAEKIFLVDGFQNVHDCLLDDHSPIELHFYAISLWVRLR